MRTSIDADGCVVIPAALREAVGLRAGTVIALVSGNGVLLVPPDADEVEERDDHLVIPRSGVVVTDEMVQALRRADQR